MMNLNPKIRNAGIAAILLSVIEILNAIVNVYPNEAWTAIVTALIPVLVGYQTKADGWSNAKA
jgi:hypothetical protein